jgi:hypothetical protein
METIKPERMRSHGPPKKYPDELRERATPMVMVERMHDESHFSLTRPGTPASIGCLRT